MAAGDVPGWVAAIAAVGGVVGGGLAAWVKLGDRVDRLEAEADANRETLRRLTDLVWTSFGIDLTRRQRRDPDQPDS